MHSKLPCKETLKTCLFPRKKKSQLGDGVNNSECVIEKKKKVLIIIKKIVNFVNLASLLNWG
jgi:hypothetical protein